jgi:hypothetical protein
VWQRSWGTEKAGRDDTIEDKTLLNVGGVVFVYLLDATNDLVSICAQ